MSNENQDKNIMRQIRTYFKGVKAEWSKVTWPTRQQVGFETVVVLIVVVFFTLVVYFMDIIFKVILDFIQKCFGG